VTSLDQAADTGGPQQKEFEQTASPAWVKMRAA